MSHLYSNITQQYKDGIHLDDCAMDAIDPRYDAGFLIEGTMFLGMARNDTSLQDKAEELAQLAISRTDWQTEDGILTGRGSGRLVRALAAVSERSSNQTFRSCVQAFIAVQYNAVRDFAGNDGDIYSTPWQGPTSPVYNFDTQTSALDALLGAVSVGKLSPQPITPAQSPPSNSLNIGAAIGGLLGGIFLFCGTTAFLLLRRRSGHGNTSLGGKFVAQMTRFTPRSNNTHERNRYAPPLGSRNHQSSNPSQLLRDTSAELEATQVNPLADSHLEAMAQPVRGVLSHNDSVSRVENARIAELIRILDERSYRDWGPPPDYRTS